MTSRPLSQTFQPRRRDERLAIHNQAAGVGLVLVLLAVSAFAVIASQLTSNAASSAVAASGLSDDYATAATAVAGEESLERKYRLEPGPAVQARYDKTAASFVGAMEEVSRDGDAEDRAFVTTMLAEHRVYLVSIRRMFGAVDRGDTPTVLRIDGDEVDPRFGAIEEAVLAAAASKHQQSLRALSGLKHLEDITSRLTPLIFVLGLVIAAVLASISRGYRRLLTVERAQAVHDSLHDSLSGLPNRTLLTDRFEQSLRADVRSGSSTGLLLIDLDRFKEINDTFGHDYGDELLAQIGPRLAAVLRDVDTVARLGGDEFAVLLPDVGSVDNALIVAAKCRGALRASFQVCGVDLDVEASVGVVVSGQHGLDTVTLLQRADIAMYVAKSQNLGVFAYTADVNKHSPARLALLGELRHALDHGELVLHYQPKIAAGSGDVIGAEALVRWQHPDRGMIFPDDFIPLVEHTGLIGPLTHYVLDTALAQIRTWSDAGRPLTVSVNLSARNLLDERLPVEVADLLAVHGVPARLLELEVTESALMTEPARAQQILERLAAMGIRISIDDFGAGYTSLSQLKTLPVSELKIDKSFVLSMDRDVNNAMIVHSVIDLGHSLGLSIVAEGVETHQALIALKDFGCDVAQGYYMSRPVPAEALDIWLSGRSVCPPQPSHLLV
jgi:diguanylate cyclase (GGDEF)-like protein